MSQISKRKFDAMCITTCDEAINNAVDKQLTPYQSLPTKRIDFIRYMTHKIHLEVCKQNGHLKTLIKLLIQSSETLTNESTWIEQYNTTNDREVFNDPIELIRPKTKFVNWNHASIQPLNWACRSGYVHLLRYLVHNLPTSSTSTSHISKEIFTPNLGNNKLHIGAVTFRSVVYDIYMYSILHIHI